MWKNVEGLKVNGQKSKSKRLLPRERDDHFRVRLGSTAQGYRLVPLQDHVVLIDGMDLDHQSTFSS
jgi:hypothetical protein